MSLGCPTVPVLDVLLLLGALSPFVIFPLAAYDLQPFVARQISSRAGQYTVLTVLALFPVLVMLTLYLQDPIHTVRRSLYYRTHPEALDALHDAQRVDQFAAFLRTMTDAQRRQPLDLGAPNTVSVSIPDTDPQCQHLHTLPPLAPGWHYRCVPPKELLTNDGTGWLPINDPIFHPFIDPRNQLEADLYYTFHVDDRGAWELRGRAARVPLHCPGNEHNKREPYRPIFLCSGNEMIVRWEPQP
jgi:hypothetical protein